MTNSRFCSLTLTLLLAACGGQGSDADYRVPADPTPTPAAADSIPCAARGAEMAAGCTIERTPSADGTILTLRHPDGGFHRLLMTKDGRGVIAADGAEPAQVTVIDKDHIEVAVGGARYRLPAKVGPVAKP